MRSWSFVSKNHSSYAQRVYFIASLKNAKEILTLQSAPIMLSPGGSQFQVGEIPILQVQGPSVLPVGIYTLCIIAIQEDNRQELGRACVTRRYEKSEIEAVSSEKENQAFSFSGQARLTAQHSNQDQLFSGVPPSFARLQASPQFSVFRIPLQGRVFLSTEAERFRYDLNTISLNLDHRQLLSQMQEKAMDQLSGKTGINFSGGTFTSFSAGPLENRLEALREEAYQKALKKLGPYRKMLDKSMKGKDFLQDSTLLSQLEDIHQIERIKSVLSSPRFDEIREGCEKLENRFSDFDQADIKAYMDSVRIKNFLSFRKLKRLREQCRELEKLEEKLQKLEETKRKLKKVIRLKEKLEESRIASERRYKQPSSKP